MLKFYYGPSGAGKSSQMQKDIISRAGTDKDRYFFVIVPDQYTLQTQKELVLRTEAKGVMNIDILSFSRLAYKVFEEVGVADRMPLDDTGKNLIIRKISLEIEDKLMSIGHNLKKTGYIHEVKSVISEFMQYGISVNDVDKLIELAGKKKALKGKLEDVKKIYEGYLSFIENKYITGEEKLEILASVICKSEMLKDSIIVLDGFTGFTPLQNHVIVSLMEACSEMWISVPVDATGLASKDDDNQLFSLSKRTIASIKKCAKDILKEDAPFVSNNTFRYKTGSALLHLENNLFRYPVKKYEGEVTGLTLSVADSPREELKNACISISKLIREKKYSYRDIAIVTGDVERYAPYAEELFKKYEIPGFVDTTRKITLNPFTEYIKSGLNVINTNFSYDSVIHFLRSGFTGLSNEEIDAFDNYIRALGVKGRKVYNDGFERYASYMYQYVDGKRTKTSESRTCLDEINRIRSYVMNILEPVLVYDRSKEYKADDIARSVYEFIVANDLYNKLIDMANSFKEQYDYQREAEYSQIYDKFMELLDTMASLLLDELVSVDEFIKIMEAGLTEIKIGVLPQGVDYVVLGDIERTRLNDIKALFFVGLNDGVVPTLGQGGGLISDIDREFLILEGSKCDIELAPSPRQKNNIQRLYLYLNMTKPTELLSLSYSKMDKDGQSIRPSYLIHTIKEMFPNLKTSYVDTCDIDSIVGVSDTKEFLANMLREYAKGVFDDDKDKLSNLSTVYMALIDQNDNAVKDLVGAAFYTHNDVRLERDIVNALYGITLNNSISRLEQYASCAYAHFLKYGIGLREREEYAFDNVDIGTIFHDVLEKFGERLKAGGVAWSDVTSDEASVIIDELVESITAEYGESVLHQDKRSRYQIERMKRILHRSVMTLGYQLGKGLFLPKSYELRFSEEIDPSNIRIGLTKEEKMIIEGKIDRVDTFEDDKKVYVKVIDYKSSGKKISLVELYYGLQLQLVVYLDQGTRRINKQSHDKEAIPAAMFYYQVADPIVEGQSDMTNEEVEELIKKELKLSGLISEDEKVIQGLDTTMDKESDIVNVKYKQDGSLSAYSSVITKDNLNIMMNYANKKIGELASEIKDGIIEPRPCGDKACEYCIYKEVCDYDATVPGYEKKIMDITESEALAAMTKELADGQD